MPKSDLNGAKILKVADIVFTRLDSIHVNMTFDKELIDSTLDDAISNGGVQAICLMAKHGLVSELQAFIGKNDKLEMLRQLRSCAAGILYSPRRMEVYHVIKGLFAADNNMALVLSGEIFYAALHRDDWAAICDGLQPSQEVIQCAKERALKDSNPTITERLESRY